MDSGGQHTRYRHERPEWGYRDLTHAREGLGFVPEDAAEDHRG